VGSRIASGGRLGELAAPKFTDQNLVLVETLNDFATSRGHTLLELAMCWPLARPAVASVIAGATKLEQVRDNAGAAGWTLTQADVAEIDAIVAPAMAAPNESEIMEVI
jgi:aryl-alcohol dehydrogenase-like predicted oxidoreductase